MSSYKCCLSFSTCVCFKLLFGVITMPPPDTRGAVRARRRSPFYRSRSRSPHFRGGGGRNSDRLADGGRSRNSDRPADGGGGRNSDRLTDEGIGRHPDRSTDGGGGRKSDRLADGGIGRDPDRPAELHLTIASLREENRDLRIENVKLEKKLNKVKVQLDIKEKGIRDKRDDLLDLREVERQLSCDLSDAHTARVNEQVQFQAEITRLQEDMADLQKSKDHALSTAMAILQRALDEDTPRRKCGTSALVSSGSTTTLSQGAASEASSTRPDKDEAMRVGDIPEVVVAFRDTAGNSGDDGRDHNQVVKHNSHIKDAVTKDSQNTSQGIESQAVLEPEADFG